MLVFISWSVIYLPTMACFMGLNVRNNLNILRFINLNSDVYQGDTLGLTKIVRLGIEFFPTVKHLSDHALQSSSTLLVSNTKLKLVSKRSRLNCSKFASLNSQTWRWKGVFFWILKLIITLTVKWSWVDTGGEIATSDIKFGALVKIWSKQSAK